MAKDKDIEWSFKTHYRTMYKLAVMLLHDDVVAKDIVQEIKRDQGDGFLWPL